MTDTTEVDLVDAAPATDVPVLRVEPLHVEPRRHAPAEHAPPATRARPTGRRLVPAMDAVGLVAAFAVGLAASRSTSLPDAGPGAFLFIPVYVLSFALYGLYRRERRRLFATSFPDLLHLLHALVAGGAATVGLAELGRHVLSAGMADPRVVLALTAPALVTVPAARAAFGAALVRRGTVRSRVIIVGSGPVADGVTRRLADHPELRLLGRVDDGPFGESTHPRLGALSELPRLCAELRADRVIVAFSSAPSEVVTDTLRELPPSVQVSIVPRLFGLVSWRSNVDELRGLPLLDVAPSGLGPAQRAAKRALDLVVSTALMLACLPTFVVVALLVKFTSPGPVFFRQERRGRGGRMFRVWKLRTMYVGADARKADLLHANDVDGPLFKMRADPRVTPVGRVLRSLSLDEVPQLLNVIKGDMSLVGPRPFTAAEADLIDGWAVRRFEVRPGMTGLWQVSGRNDLPFDELRRLDYICTASWSFWWDLKILWHTPAAVMRRRGAY